MAPVGPPAPWCHPTPSSREPTACAAAKTSPSVALAAATPYIWNDRAGTRKAPATARRPRPSSAMAKLFSATQCSTAHDRLFLGRRSEPIPELHATPRELASPSSSSTARARPQSAVAAPATPRGSDRAGGQQETIAARPQSALSLRTPSAEVSSPVTPTPAYKRPASAVTPRVTTPIAVQSSGGSTLPQDIVVATTPPWLSDSAAVAATPPLSAHPSRRPRSALAALKTGLRDAPQAVTPATPPPASKRPQSSVGRLAPQARCNTAGSDSLAATPPQATAVAMPDDDVGVGQRLADVDQPVAAVREPLVSAEVPPPTPERLARVAVLTAVVMPMYAAGKPYGTQMSSWCAWGKDDSPPALAADDCGSYAPNLVDGASAWAPLAAVPEAHKLRRDPILHEVEAFARNDEGVITGERKLLEGDGFRNNAKATATPCAPSSVRRNVGRRKGLLEFEDLRHQAAWDPTFRAALAQNSFAFHRRAAGKPVKRCGLGKKSAASRPCGAAQPSPIHSRPQNQLISDRDRLGHAITAGVPLLVAP